MPLHLTLNLVLFVPCAWCFDINSSFPVCFAYTKWTFCPPFPPLLERTVIEIFLHASFFHGSSSFSSLICWNRCQIVNEVWHTVTVCKTAENAHFSSRKCKLLVFSSFVTFDEDGRFFFRIWCEISMHYYFPFVICVFHFCRSHTFLRSIKSESPNLNILPHLDLPDFEFVYTKVKTIRTSTS